MFAVYIVINKVYNNFFINITILLLHLYFWAFLGVNQEFLERKGKTCWALSFWGIGICSLLISNLSLIKTTFPKQSLSHFQPVDQIKTSLSFDHHINGILLNAKEVEQIYFCSPWRSFPLFYWRLCSSLHSQVRSFSNCRLYSSSLAQTDSKVV